MFFVSARSYNDRSNTRRSKSNWKITCEPHIRVTNRRLAVVNCMGVGRDLIRTEFKGKMAWDSDDVYNHFLDSEKFQRTISYARNLLNRTAEEGGRRG